MLYALVSFSDQIGPLNVFRYITFRTGGAIMTALLFVFLLVPPSSTSCASSRARASPSARTGRPRTSPRRARRPWAGS